MRMRKERAGNIFLFATPGTYGISSEDQPLCGNFLNNMSQMSYAWGGHVKELAGNFAGFPGG
ncbi:hypothetical protein [Rhizobium paknamense]|uniref:Uncharacterized protein n=1 Tax=Rhizobium paknamense TaxID=1206817 RepID=A0ABU0I6E5_9HYPH|nr:hypothetical protein [Rhizobium paknamense]MDQ0453795.1 hypothetical protein [Rhizobium paknamense]